MKTRLILLILILTGLLISQTEKGISIKSKPGNEGKRWAVCVGINEYQFPGILNLEKARNDAEALGEVLEKYGQFDYVFTLTDKKDAKSMEYPALRKLKAKLNYLKDFLEPEDLVVFSFSGHGITDEKGDSYFVVADTDPDDIFNTSLKLKEVTDLLAEAGVRKSLLLVDACREAFQKNKGINKNGLRSQKFEKSEVAATFYATKDGWYSYEDEKGQYGAFTNYVLKGLQGEADKSEYQGNGDGIISFSELSFFVEEGVTDWALENGKRQKPYTKIYGEKYGDLALSSYEWVSTNEAKQEANSPNVPKKEIKHLQEKLTSKYGIELIGIKGGKFKMGSEEGNSDERPIHEVELSDYYIGKYEVAQKKYIEIMGKNPSKFKEGDFPQENINWIDAVEFCNKLSEIEGLDKCYKIQIEKGIFSDSKSATCNFEANGYRLPTEAEWEFAARGGNQSNNFEYSGSNNIDEVAWYSSNSGRKIQPFGTKEPNELGLYDMSGNVWEWCNDLYDKNYYVECFNLGIVKDPIGPSLGSNRVIRGGSWYNYASYCRVAYRSNYNPDGSGSNRGFRVVRLP